MFVDKLYNRNTPKRCTVHSEEVKLLHALPNITRRHFRQQNAFQTRNNIGLQYSYYKSLRKPHHKNVMQYETFGVK